MDKRVFPDLNIVLLGKTCERPGGWTVCHIAGVLWYLWLCNCISQKQRRFPK